MQAVKPKLTPQTVAWYNDWDEPFIIEGVIIAYPDERDAYTQLRVQVNRMHPIDELAFTHVEGKLLARVSPSRAWQYGDRIRLEGYLTTPPQDEIFSYRQYLYRQGILSYIKCGQGDCAQFLGEGFGSPLLQGIYALRDSFENILYQLFPDPEASLLNGILLGIEGRIPEQVSQAFKDTGTAHIIAISGFNFAIIAGLFTRMFSRLMGRWRGMVIAFAAMGMYTILAGANAAVIRAALMGVLSVFAAQIGRRQSGINSLAFVSALISLFNPHALWDVSFQLSAMATLGLVLYAEPFTQTFIATGSRYLSPITVQRLAKPVSEYFLFTLAAQLTTLPVTVYHFERFSISSFIANVLILPAQPPLMVLGGLTLLTGWLWMSLARLLAVVPWVFAVYTIRIVEWFAGMTWGVWALGSTSLAAIWLFYFCLFSWTYLGDKIKVSLTKRWGGFPVKRPLFVLLILSVGTLLLWQTVLTAPDGRLHVLIMDVGSGDGILVITPSGERLLIDGGPSPTRLADSLGRRIPLMERKLEYLIVAGIGEEQLGALPWVVERYPPEHVLWSGSTAATYSARQLHAHLLNKGTPVDKMQTGQTLDLGKGAQIRILAVTRRGSVLLLEWKDFRLLLPIGLDFESLQTLLEDREHPPVSVLLLADSGFAPLTPATWVQRWEPQLVLISVAADDLAGRPNPEALEAVYGYPLLRTDMHGWIRLSTDGERMWVEAEKVQADIGQDE